MAGFSLGRDTALRDPQGLPRPVRWGWAVGGVADNLLFGGMAALTLPVYHLHWGLDPRWVGACLLVARVVGVLCNPLVGYWSDTAGLRWGRRRPFVLAGTLGCAALFPLAWQPLVREPWGMALNLVVALVLLSFSYDLFFVPYNALGYELSRDPRERTSVQAAFMVCGLGAGLVVPNLYPWAVRCGQGSSFGVGVWRVSVAVGVVVAVAGMVAVGATRGRDRGGGTARPSSFRDAGWAVVRDRRFARLLGAYACAVCGLFLWPALLVYVNTFGVFGSDEGLGSTVSGISGMFAVAGAVSGVFAGEWLAGRLGKLRVLRLGLGVAALASLAMAHGLDSSAWGVSLPLGHWRPILREQYLVFFLFGAGQQAAWLMFGSVVADLCGLEEARSGQGRQGVYSAAYNVAFHLSVAVGALVSGFLLAASGMGETPGVGNTESGALALLHLLVGAQVVGAVAAIALLGRFPSSDVESVGKTT